MLHRTVKAKPDGLVELETTDGQRVTPTIYPPGETTGRALNLTDTRKAGRKWLD